MAHNAAKARRRGASVERAFDAVMASVGLCKASVRPLLGVCGASAGLLLVLYRASVRLLRGLRASDPPTHLNAQPPPTNRAARVHVT